MSQEEIEKAAAAIKISREEHNHVLIDVVNGEVFNIFECKDRRLDLTKP